MSRFPLNHGMWAVAGVWAAMFMVCVPAAVRAQAVDTAMPAARAAAAGSPRGIISGVVRDTAGRAIAGVHVSAGADFQTLTDSAGAYTLRGVPDGAITVRVRRLGFEPASSLATVGATPAVLDLRVTPAAQMLAAVRVRAHHEPYESRLAGFNARRAKKLGYYITREQIAQRNDSRLTDALRLIPGVQPYRMPGALGTTVRLAGAQCPPLVFVDGFPASLGRFDLDMIDLTSVEGIEVYQNGSSVPSAFMGPYGTEQCGVIAIWSAPMRPNRRANQLPAEPVDVNALVKSGAVHLPSTVDEQARYVGESARPAYPDSLLRAKVAGHVLAQFVVDTAGDVEDGTVSIVAASSPAFAAAVRDAVGDARFHPARVDKHPVRALVQLPFDFDPSAPEPRVNVPDGPAAQ